MIDPDKMEWRQVKEFPHLEVSEYGDLRRAVARSVGQGSHTPVGKIYKTKKARSSYVGVRVSLNGRRYSRYQHILVALAFLQVPDNYKDLRVNHKDGNTRNNHYSNLEWCTNSENALHSLYVLGNIKNIAKGVKNGRAKLTEIDVRNIRELYANGNKLVTIESMYPLISKSQICRVCVGQQWAWLEQKGQAI